MKIVKCAIVMLVSLLFFGNSEAQTREDVITSFNEGFALFNEQGDNLGAIAKFEETIDLAEKVGSEADDIKQRAISQIPRLAFMHGAQLIRERKLDVAIDAFEETMRLAEKYGDNDIYNRARGNMPALYLNLGNQFYRVEEDQNALEMYEKAIELNPSYVSAYYQMGLVYRRLDDVDATLENLDTSIDLARQGGDQENMERSQRAARDYLVYLASEQIESENYNRGLDLLNRAAGYGESASLHYRFAETYNHLGRHNEALTSAQRALKLENGGPTDQARVYFEIGLANKGLDNVSAACSAFRNALFGDFQSPAEHEIQHELECK